MKLKVALLGILASGSLLLSGTPNVDEQNQTGSEPNAVASVETAITASSESEPEIYTLPGDTIPTRPIPGVWSTTDPYSSDTGISPMISPVICGGRLDWYRLVETSGKNHCYRNAGTTSAASHHNIKGQCPGANKGRFQYQINGVKYWSQARGPVANHRTCYWFANNASHWVRAVQIY